MTDFKLDFSTKANAITANVQTDELLGYANVDALSTISGTFGAYNKTTDFFEIIGTDEGDTFIAGDGGSKITGGKGGGDTLTGGTGEDLFYYAAGETAGNDAINGGGGKDDAIVISGGPTSSGVDFEAASISGVESLIFMQQAFVSLLTTQVGASGISNFVGTGSFQTPTVFLSVAAPDTTFDMANLTFTNWEVDAFAAIRVQGSSGHDVIKGNAGVALRIDGGAGADSMTGSNKSDEFGFGDGSELAAGEIINGLEGQDQLFTYGGGTYDFTQATLKSVEAILTDNDIEATFLFKGSQIGGKGITLINWDSDATLDLSVTGHKVSLAGLELERWTADDSIAIIGTKKADVLTGSNEDDLFKGGKGADHINGGLGVDTVDFSSETKAVVLSLHGGKFATARIGGHASDQVKNVEHVIGGLGNDKLTGDGGSNILQGGFGNDKLTGKDGSDLFIFDDNKHMDTVTDFATGTDHIQISLNAFPAFGLLADHILTATDFAIGLPTTTVQFFYYTDGILYFDGDGNGSSAEAEAIADLKGAALVAGDIMLIA